MYSFSYHFLLSSPCKVSGYSKVTPIVVTVLQPFLKKEPIVVSIVFEAHYIPKHWIWLIEHANKLTLHIHFAVQNQVY